MYHLQLSGAFRLGLALLLLKAAGDFLLKDPGFFVFGVGVILLVFVISYVRKFPDLSALILMIIAGAMGVFLYGVPEIYLIGMPTLMIPGISDFISSIPELVLPQALITITNAILATSLLSKDLFDREIPPEKLSRTIGVMNIISAPFGGFPMCHGAGGMAAQYRFGARTGGSNIFAGIILLIIAIFFAGPGYSATDFTRNIWSPAPLCRYRDGKARVKNRLPASHRRHGSPCITLCRRWIHCRDGPSVPDEMEQGEEIKGERYHTTPGPIKKLFA